MGDTPGGIWICPALLGFWLLIIGVQWLLARRERRRHGGVRGGPFRDH